MRKILAALFAILGSAALVSCVDFDEFGESDYCVLSDITVKEQEGTTSPDAQNRTFTSFIKARALPDSVTLDDVDISALAELRRVESKIDGIPADSAELDSLAAFVALAKENVRKGSRVRLPRSGKIFWAVVSESGRRSLWLHRFELVEPDDDDGGSGEGGSSETAGSSATETSSSSAASSDVRFELSIEGQIGASSLRPGENGAPDTLLVALPYGSDVSALRVSATDAHEAATVVPDPSATTDFSSPVEFVVTAEDGTRKSWIVAVEVKAQGYVASSEKEFTSLSADGESEAVTWSAQRDTATLHFSSFAARTAAVVRFAVSEGATVRATTEKGTAILVPGTALDLSSPVVLTVTAEDGSAATVLLVADSPLPPPPRVLSFASASFAVSFDSTSSDTTRIFVEADYPNTLKSVPVSFALTDGATASGLVSGESADLARAKPFSVSNGVETKFYSVQAGYQLPYSDFDSWTQGDTALAKGNWTDPWTGSTFTTVWGSGNQYSGVSMILSQATNNRTAVQMKTDEINLVVYKKLAAGNLFTGNFNPNNVGQMSMAGYDDGNELIDFGKPFAGRPTFVEIEFSYAKAGSDSCDLYVLLENRGGTRSSNVGRSTAQVNKLVASAWYRSMSDNDTADPDVVSISAPNAQGLRTLRMKFKYGAPHASSPIHGSNALATGLKSSDGIYNGLKAGDSYANEDVTHIRVVFSSSAMGNLYKGSKNSALVVGNMRLVYDP